MLTIIRRSVFGLAVVAVLLSSQTQSLDAQGTGTPGGAAALPTNVVKQSRPYYAEGAVVGLLMAAAIFSVCRSSRRV